VIWLANRYAQALARQADAHQPQGVPSLDPAPTMA
jgi:hypothetical protein